MSKGMKAFVYYSFWVVVVFIGLEFGDVITGFVRTIIWGE
jgi:hypothetical protein